MRLTNSGGIPEKYSDFCDYLELCVGSWIDLTMFARVDPPLQVLHQFGQWCQSIKPTQIAISTLGRYSDKAYTQFVLGVSYRFHLNSPSFYIVHHGTVCDWTNSWCLNHTSRSGRWLDRSYDYPFNCNLYPFFSSVFNLSDFGVG